MENAAVAKVLDLDRGVDAGDNRYLDDRAAFLPRFDDQALARHQIDTQGVQLLTDWINGLADCGP